MEKLMAAFDNAASAKGVWSPVCKHHVVSLKIPTYMLDEEGNGICRVNGCFEEAEYFMSFSEVKNSKAQKEKERVETNAKVIHAIQNFEKAYKHLIQSLGSVECSKTQKNLHIEHQLDAQDVLKWTRKTKKELQKQNTK